MPETPDAETILAVRREICGPLLDAVAPLVEFDPEELAGAVIMGAVATASGSGNPVGVPEETLRCLARWALSVQFGVAMLQSVLLGVVETRLGAGDDPEFRPAVSEEKAIRVLAAERASRRGKGGAT